MNLINAFGLLNMINEDLDDYQEEYTNYVIAHKERVSQVADWLKENLPEVFTDVDLEFFDNLIDSHDESKFSEEEFEAYAQYFYGDKKNKKEFENAWRHHWMHNEHHPEFWMGEDMPYVFILEMLCDWGSFSIEKKDFKELSEFYFNKAKDDEEKSLSEATKEVIEDILSKVDTIIERE